MSELYPDEEDARAEALASLNLLDSPPEERFDRLCRLAQEAMGAPAAYISLIDRRRQWFKATVGMGDMKETPREGTFCDYAIRRSRPTFVLDATRDPLFCKSPYVQGEPRVRFYAGYPLTVAGQRVGTLCTLDFQPRSEVTPKQKEQLQALAEQAQSELTGATDERPAERREVTVLQARLVGFTESSLEPREAARLLNRFQETMIDKLHAWGGQIDELAGEGIRAYFETPLEAAACAAEMQLAIHDLELHCGIALSTGTALLGSFGAGEWSKPLLAGAPVHHAARCLEWAEAGDILVSESTRQALGDDARYEERIRIPGEHLHRLAGVRVP